MINLQHTKNCAKIFFGHHVYCENFIMYILVLSRDIGLKFTKF